MEYAYNGWPASSDPTAIGVDVSFHCYGVPFPGGVKGGPVAVVLGYLVHELHDRVEPVVDGWCWGYAYRANVNNPTELSCHAAATAVDYNAPNHPNGTSSGPDGGGGWTPAQWHEIQAILAELDNVVRWLDGNDPMHFEISGTPDQVLLVADRIAHQGDDMPLNDDDLAAISGVVDARLDQFFRAEKLIVTNDRASTPNDVPYSYETAMERIIRLVSATFVGESGQPHND